MTEGPVWECVIGRPETEKTLSRGVVAVATGAGDALAENILCWHVSHRMNWRSRESGVDWGVMDFVHIAQD